MTCDDFELLLGDTALSPEAQAHVDGCAECARTLAVVRLALLPPPDEAAVVSPDAALRAWRRDFRPPVRRSRAARVAMAAGVVALVAAGALWAHFHSPTTSEATAAQATALEPTRFSLATQAEGDFDEFEDEVSFEVSWPDEEPTEGEL